MRISTLVATVSTVVLATAGGVAAATALTPTTPLGAPHAPTGPVVIITGAVVRPGAALVDAVSAIATDADGAILLSDSSGVLSRVDPSTGAWEPVLGDASAPRLPNLTDGADLLDIPKPSTAAILAQSIAPAINGIIIGTEGAIWRADPDGITIVDHLAQSNLLVSMEAGPVWVHEPADKSLPPELWALVDDTAQRRLGLDNTPVAIGAAGDAVYILDRDRRRVTRLDLAQPVPRPTRVVTIDRAAEQIHPLPDGRMLTVTDRPPDSNTASDRRFLVLHSPDGDELAE
ncbi:MAG: hypothetical protein GY704_16715, partial [Phycisphaeraceae bacterium]|nr:hypothetical protein [Phycisphaeraceae bacterium]